MKQLLSTAFLLMTVCTMAQDDKQGVTNAVTDYVDAFYLGGYNKDITQYFSRSSKIWLFQEERGNRVQWRADVIQGNAGLCHLCRKKKTQP